jgi:hypothetical protein
MVQQQAWMAYSCSSYFSDQFSYITHFIWSYSLKDINRQILQKEEKDREKGLDWKGVGLLPAAWRGGAGGPNR